MAMMDATSRPGEAQSLNGWRRPTFGELLQRPLPHLGLMDRSLMRTVGYWALPRFTAVSGLEHIAPGGDPFILALNHASRLEALAVPALLIYHRGGARVHFMADWNFQLIPGIGLLYRRAGAIVVTRKPARPGFLNVLKPLYTHARPSIERARDHLAAGRSIAIFTEGTVNRNPERLLRGRLGAARLSLETGASIVPGGIRITGGTPSLPLLEVRFGAPLRPSPRAAADGPAREVATAEVRAWHARMMTEISRLSGKAWEPLSQESSHGTP
jgi:1-acyl-sn-glycerol-3-phosphate acyltransferase